MLLKYQIAEHRGAHALDIYVVVGEALSTIYRRNSGEISCNYSGRKTLL